MSFFPAISKTTIPPAPRTVFRKKDGTGYAVWNCRLSPIEYVAMSEGKLHPLSVRPYSLIYYVDGPNATALYKKFQDSEENS